MSGVSQQRQAVLNKIEEYERLGLFDRDAEDDPPTVLLRPGQVDYTGKRLSTRIYTRVANHLARRHFDRLIREGLLVTEAVLGMENYRSVEGGAVITCNHFHPYDNYIVYNALREELGKRDLYKIIREGNYTSFTGLYGYFFRHCNTLPLSDNPTVMREMMRGVDTLLRRGEKILIYPEQSMWYNYRKPKPLKDGAFRFAAKAGVPVIPCFITMRNTERQDADGLPVQAHTLHIMKPIYPCSKQNIRENVAYMKERNYALCVAKYEEIYGEKLIYNCNAAQ